MKIQSYEVPANHFISTMLGIPSKELLLRKETVGEVVFEISVDALRYNVARKRAKLYLEGLGFKQTTNYNSYAVLNGIYADQGRVVIIHYNVGLPYFTVAIADATLIRKNWNTSNQINL